MSSHTWIAILSLACSTAITSAATITRTYSISGSGKNFNSEASGIIPFQLSGSFTYVIPEIGVPYFSSFIVGPTYSANLPPGVGVMNLTAMANNPTINWLGPSCTGSTVGAVATLRLMTTCLNSQTSTAKARWILSAETYLNEPSRSRRILHLTQGFGFSYGGGFGLSLALDSIYVGSEQYFSHTQVHGTEIAFFDTYYGALEESGTLFQIGNWTTTLVSETTDSPQVPEPATLLLASVSIGLALWAKRR